ncbi:PQQ-dependent sugar dehydrogenase [Promicromonospora sp. MEB111]|uniref:PQQ-dependent sugar dehydrogenase n=1 Tax=Promicromonospora sp. MEB111 TaxID=3040301 RepID=UPI00254DB813|nr:PQQ-dependent sugar dehydrogenase [Promicromonospora sp. MEB111]
MDTDAGVRRHLLTLVLPAFVLVAGVSGCSGSAEPGVVSPSPSASESTSSGTAAPSGTDPSNGADPWDGEVTAEAEVVAQELPVPWGIAPLPGGRFLVTTRDDAALAVVHPNGDVEPLDASGGAQELADQTMPGGEGGLLGVAVDPEDTGPTFTVFLYRTGAEDNAVLRAELDLDGVTLRDVTTILDGIPSASNHNGGRIALGPDGYLYVATGDAGNPANAQDPESLGGKILRITADGEPAPGNPDPGSPVWSLGHRNVQGLGWDASGRMFASEFGQDRLDELNVIEAGGNYGWPDVEGPGERAGFVDPVAWWPTSEASPSGIAVTDEAVYLAALRGERLWRVPLLGTAQDVAGGESPGFGEPQELLAREYGRLRAVQTGNDGELYVLTGNTDGRGEPATEDGRPVDDRLLRVTLTPGG